MRWYIPPNHPRRKHLPPRLQAGNLQPVPDISGGLLEIQWLEIITGGNALIQLAKLRAAKKFHQLGLANQDNLQQLAGIGFPGL